MSRLREIRESKRLRREEVAVAAGVSFEYVRRLEGHYPPVPGLEVARAIAEALGVSVDEAFPPQPALTVVEPAEQSR